MLSSQASASYRESRRAFLKAAPLAGTTFVLADGWLPLHGAAQPASPTDAAIDSKHMRDLAAWTALTMSTPNPVPFGAEIVHTKNSERLVRALNAVFPDHDPSAHAEVHTIRLACNMLKKTSLAGYTLYTTCEPCPMCLGAIYWARISRVYFANADADASRIGFDDSLIYRELTQPHSQRKIPMIQMMREEASAAFRAWENKTNKIKY